MLKAEIKETEHRIREYVMNPWTEEMYTKVWNLICEGAEESYAEFTRKLLPEVEPGCVIGIRLPYLRRYAAAIAKKDRIGYLDAADKYAAKHTVTVEENLLRAFVIGKIPDWGTAKPQIERFLPWIDNWSVNDSFCTSLKVAKSEPELVWSYLKECVETNEPYRIRFAMVMMLNYFLMEPYLDDVLAICNRSTWEGYYVQMAVAWVISMCYVADREKTKKFLVNCELDDFTYNKSIQKMIESRQVSTEEKQVLKTYRRR